MRLIVTIPERWQDAGCPVGWALLNHDATLAREGEGSIGELPKAQHVTAVMPASRVLLTAAKLPARGARRVRGALAYAIEDQLTSDPESVHAVAGPALPDGRQSIAVIDRAWLRTLLAAFESAGAQPQSVTVETCVVPRARGEWSVVLRGGAGFVRTGDASGMALDGADDGAAPVLLRLALKHAQSAGSAPEKIVVRSGAAVDLLAWERELGVRCETARASRAWHPSERPVIELLQGEFAPKSGLLALWPRLRPAAILVAAAGAIEIVGVFAQWSALRYEKAQLEARMSEQFRTAFPQAQAIVDPALQMKRNLHAARAAAGMAQQSDFLPLLAQASRTATGARWKVKTVGYDAGRLTLDVLLASRGEADSILKRYEQESVDVALEAATPKAAGGEARFVFVPRSAR
jgi:general secretion pathway protein L